MATIFGLDIGTANIKVVQISGSRGKVELLAAGMAPTPGKGALSEADADQQELANAVRALVVQAKIMTPNVVASLPESQIFTRVIETATLTDSELQSAIKYEAEQYIPLPMSEVKLDYQVLSRPPEGTPNAKMEILLVAAPNVLVNRYLKILSLAGLKPYALGTEVTAGARSLTSTLTSAPTTLILEIGATTTELAVIEGEELVMTRSIATGGLAFTRAIAQDLGFELTQAEEYKTTYGLDASQLEGKIASAIKPIVDVVMNEVKRAIAYQASRNQEKSVKRIVVAGGSAKMPGLIPYLTEVTGLEAELANPWESVAFNHNVSPDVLDNGAIYAIAAGLAEKDIFES